MDSLFEECREDPPLYKNQTPVAGAIYWEKSLFHRMKRTILRFMTLEAMMQTEQGKAVLLYVFVKLLYYSSQGFSCLHVNHCTQ